MTEEKRRYLKEIFPWAAVDYALERHSGMSTDWLANHIAENLAKLTTESVLRKSSVSTAASSSTTEPFVNIIEKLRPAYREFLKASFKKGMKKFPRQQSKRFRAVIGKIFFVVPEELIDEVFKVTRSRRLAVYCLMAMIMNDWREDVAEVGIKLEEWYGTVQRMYATDGWAETGIEKYKAINKFNFKLVEFEPIIDVKSLQVHPTVTCPVCYEDCFEDFTIPCGSDSENCHRFCKNCIVSHASAATENMPMAEDGEGLTCMEVECKNAIYLVNIRSIIPAHILSRLDERIFEENIGASGVKVERCQKCNFVIEMETCKEVDKVFHCPHCGYARCRLCDRPWNEFHFGATCEELDVKEGNAPYWRAVETRLNEAVTRRCYSCKLQYVKIDGCNFITCRCRATQCYICRAKNINYGHFCDHVKSPNDKRCKKCNSCMLYDDATAHDNSVVRDIMRKAHAEAPTTIDTKAKAA